MKTVLIIEDDKIIRENASEILELAGFDVETADNGKDGSLIAKKIIPDLIICDILMPQLDGYGVLYVLSKDPVTAKIPFIFLSAKTELTDIRKGMELGADDYLCKPFDDTDLLSSIEVRLKKHDVLKESSGDNSDSNDSDNLILDDNSSKIDELQSLTLKRPISTYKKKEIIFHAGDTPQYVYYLKKGRVKSYKTHDDGKEYITNMYIDGEFFGHPALFTNNPFNDSTVVLQTSEIIKIPKDNFLELIYNNRKIASKFIKLLSGSIENQELQLVSLAYDTVRKRTAEALVFLSGRYSIEKNGRNAIVISREDLAGLAGTAMETVIRCLGEFKEDSLITVEGRDIYINNFAGLKGI